MKLCWLPIYDVEPDLDPHQSKNLKVVEANSGAVEAHNGVVVANNRDSHHFDEEPDLDLHQCEKSDPDLNQRIKGFGSRFFRSATLLKGTIVPKGLARSRFKPT